MFRCLSWIFLSVILAGCPDDSDSRSGSREFVTHGLPLDGSPLGHFRPSAEALTPADFAAFEGDVEHPCPLDPARSERLRRQPLFFKTYTHLLHHDGQGTRVESRRLSARASGFVELQSTTLADLEFEDSSISPSNGRGCLLLAQRGSSRSTLERGSFFPAEGDARWSALRRTSRSRRNVVCGGQETRNVEVHEVVIVTFEVPPTRGCGPGRVFAYRSLFDTQRDVYLGIRVEETLSSGTIPPRDGGIRFPSRSRGR